MRTEYGRFKAKDKADVEKAARAAGEINASFKRNWHPRAVGKARSYSQSTSTCENANLLEKEKAYI